MMSAHLIHAAAGTPFYLDSKFWVLVPLVLFLALIAYKGAFKAMGKSLDDRADKIKAELDEARRLREEAQQLLASYHRKQKEAEEQAEEIVKQARSDAENMAVQARKDLTERLERRAAQAEAKIANAEAQAMSEVKAKAADLAMDTAETLLRTKMTAAEKSKQYGIQLAYHNHAFEFKPLGENSRCGYDVMMEEFSSDMKFEVDVFWVAVANRDPVELIHRLDSRVTQLHLKDLSATTKVPSYEGVSPEAFEEIGDGIIDMNPIMQAALQAGVEHCHIEQDQSPDALASIRKSIGHLKQM